MSKVRSTSGFESRDQSTLENASYPIDASRGASCKDKNDAASISRDSHCVRHLQQRHVRHSIQVRLQQLLVLERDDGRARCLCGRRGWCRRLIAAAAARLPATISPRRRRRGPTTSLPGQPLDIERQRCRHLAGSIAGPSVLRQQTAVHGAVVDARQVPEAQLAVGATRQAIPVARSMARTPRSARPVGASTLVAKRVSMSSGLSWSTSHAS
jgi:hypothetical protein